MARITCHRCGVQADRHSSAAKYCNQCAALQSAASQAATRVLTKQIRQGLIPKAKDCTCVDCGIPAFDYDHRDYSRPLDVQPVCRGCNVRRGPAIAI